MEIKDRYISLKFRETQESLWMARWLQKNYPDADLAWYRYGKKLTNWPTLECCLCGSSQVKIWWSILINFFDLQNCAFLRLPLWQRNHGKYFHSFILPLNQWIFTLNQWDSFNYTKICKCRQKIGGWNSHILVELIIRVFPMENDSIAQFISNCFRWPILFWNDIF